MTKYSSVLLSIHLCVLVCLSSAQRHGPWRQKVQWENNGQVFSLLSSGTQYHTLDSAQRNPRFFLTRHVIPRYTGRILLRRFVGPRAHPEYVPEHMVSTRNVGILGADTRSYMVPARTSQSRSNGASLPSLHTEQIALLRSESVRSGASPTGTTTRAPWASSLTTTLNPRKLVSRRVSPVSTTAAPTNNNSSEEKPLAQPQRSTIQAKNSELSRTSLVPVVSLVSASVNMRDGLNLPLHMDGGGDSMIGDEPNTVHGTNSFNFNLLPYGSTNIHHHSQSGYGTRYFHNGKTT